MKKCISCGKLHERLVKKCKTCVNKENVRQKKQYQERLAQGLCPRCGGQPIEGSKHCGLCKARVRDKDRKIRLKRFSDDKCGYCGHNSPVDGQRTCSTCLKKLCKLHNNRATKLGQSGLCVRCGKFPQLCGINRRGNSHNTCQKCYLRHLSGVNLGSAQYADALLQKLKDQNYRCPYTDDQLVLGDHIWIDHIMPRSRFPELAKDINNIEWVTETVNRMKQNRTPEEFLLLIKQIYDHRYV